MTDDDINTKGLFEDQIKELQYLVNRLRHDNKRSDMNIAKFYDKTILEFKKEQIQKMISDAYQYYLEKHYPGLTNDRAAFEFCEIYLEDKEE